MPKLSGPRTILALDLRALAAFRVAIGALLVIDVLTRWQDLAAHYTNFGILPIGPYLQEFYNRFHTSLHLANGGMAWQALLFTLTLLAGLAVTFGYRTRLTTAVAWVLLISMHNRNPFVLNGGDVLLRMLYFWGLFLPLGARYSIDAALVKTPLPRENRYLAGAGIALLLQVIFVYGATAALKSGKEWWPEGTASYYALSLDQFTTRFGTWLSQWHEFLRIGTYGVHALEAMAPLLLLCPVSFAGVRTLTITALIFMHLNFDLTMRLGIFPWVDIAALIALLPTEVWDVLTRRFKTAARLDLKIYYDGECGFCRKMCLILREFLLIPETTLAPAQSDPRAAELLAKEYSWVVVDAQGEAHLRFDGVVTMIEHVPILGPLARRLPLRRLRVIGDPCYRFIARHRGTLGKITGRLLPYKDQREPGPHWLRDGIALIFIVYVGLWNLQTIPATGVTIPSPWDRIGPILRLDQKWNMFAPYPLKNDGWYVIDGALMDGTRVDVLAGTETPTRYEKPELVSLQHRNARWRKYLMTLNSSNKSRHRLYYGRYLCRSWNQDREGDKRLATFEIVFMQERTPPPGRTPTVQKVRLWQHDCFKKP